MDHCRIRYGRIRNAVFLYCWWFSSSMEDAILERVRDMRFGHVYRPRGTLRFYTGNGNRDRLVAEICLFDIFVMIKI